MLDPAPTAPQPSPGSPPPGAHPGDLPQSADPPPDPSPDRPGDLPTSTPGQTASGKPWQVCPADSARVTALAHDLGCPTPIAHLLASRELTPADLPHFFEPALAHLHSPSLLLGLPEAVTRIRAAIAAREPILIYGDYDVDGTTATVLLKTAIDRVANSNPDRVANSNPDRIAAPGQPSLVTWHVPHRIREGYGMQAGRLAEAALAGVRLVISVDTGVRAFAAAEEARALSLDLIVTDHHLPDAAQPLPHALAVINPNQPGCPYPFKQLCGAAIAFKLAHALLEAHAHAADNPRAALAFLNDRLLPSLLKLVAIATIADSVPLTGENRTLVALGLRELANPVQPGLRALMQVASLPLDHAPSVTDVGFRLGPRINAAGRMDVADDVIELFLTRSPARALELATKLNDLNDQRRATEREALDAIEEHLTTLLDNTGAYPAECLVLDHPDWHRGVLGILASRVVERTGRPALVLTHADGEAHGSGRSVAGFHLLDALTAAHTHEPTPTPLLTRFGGHAYAVGLSLPSAHLPLLRSRLRSVTLQQRLVESLSPPLTADLELSAADLTTELANWLERCGPFGAGFHEPTLLIRGLTITAPLRRIKDRHLCLTLATSPGQPPLQALAWSRAIDWLAVAADFNLAPGTRIDVLARLTQKQSQWFTGLELDLRDLQRS